MWCQISGPLPVLLRNYENEHEAKILWQLRSCPSAIPGIPVLLGVTEDPNCLVMLDYSDKDSTTLKTCLEDPMQYRQGIAVLMLTAKILNDLHLLGFAYLNLNPETVIFSKSSTVYLTRFERCVNMKTMERSYGLRVVAQDIVDLIYLASLLLDPEQYNLFKDSIDFRNISALDVYNGLAHVLADPSHKSVNPSRDRAKFLISQGPGVNLGLFFSRL